MLETLLDALPDPVLTWALRRLGITAEGLAWLID